MRTVIEQECEQEDRIRNVDQVIIVGIETGDTLRCRTVDEQVTEFIDGVSDVDHSILVGIATGEVAGRLDLVDGDDCRWEDVPLQTLAERDELRAYLHDGFWQPMDTVRERDLLTELWHSGEAPWRVW